MSLIIVPSIDLRSGQVVRLQQGDYARQIDYPVDPVAVARQYAADGAAWLHVVDLDGARDGRVAQAELIGQIIRASDLRVQVGGGVRSTDDITRLLDAGAKRVVVGTQAIEDWPWFERVARDQRMADRLTLALDAKDGLIATRAWTQTTALPATDIAARVTGWNLAAILYTDVARDGMLAGVNLPATLALAAAGDTPVIASGGIGSIEHVRALRGTPLWGVIVGRSLYEKKLSLRDALAAARGV